MDKQILMHVECMTHMHLTTDAHAPMDGYCPQKQHCHSTPDQMQYPDVRAFKTIAIHVYRCPDHTMPSVFEMLTAGCIAASLAASGVPSDLRPKSPCALCVVCS